MRKLTFAAVVAFCFLVVFTSAFAQDGGDPSGDANCASNPCLTTYHNNNMRNGLNIHETSLVATGFPSGWGATAYVGSGGNGSIDAMIYAQPLYIPSVNWGGSANCAKTPTDMVYVATENNTIYAIQADTPYAICGSVSLNLTGANADTSIPVTALPLSGKQKVPCNNLTGSSTYGTVGVTGTPVIDPNQSILFVVSSHQGGTTQNPTYTQRLNAIDITTLTIKNTLDLPTYINKAMPPSGKRLRIGGCVIVRQRPGTAKGFVFLSIEDETGVANAIVTPDLFHQNRLLLTSERFLAIEGILQNQDNVISVKAERVQPLFVTKAETVSHDFH